MTADLASVEGRGPSRRGAKVIRSSQWESGFSPGADGCETRHHHGIAGESGRGVRWGVVLTSRGEHRAFRYARGIPTNPGDGGCSNARLHQRSRQVGKIITATMARRVAAKGASRPRGWFSTGPTVNSRRKRSLARSGGQFNNISPGARGRFWHFEYIGRPLLPTRSARPSTQKFFRGGAGDKGCRQQRSNYSVGRHQRAGG